jgi:hypothetical protein
VIVRCRRQQGQPDQQNKKQNEAREREGTAGGHGQVAAGRRRGARQHDEPGDRTQHDRADLAPRGRKHQRHDGGEHGHGGAFAVRGERLRHAPHRLGHHGDRRDFQPMQPATTGRAGETLDPVGEQHHGERGGQGETGPSRERTGDACADEANADAHLARRGAGQKLAQRDQVRVGGLAEPRPARDEFGAEIPEMCDRPAERREAELEERAQHLRPTAARLFGHRRSPRIPSVS